MAIVLIMEWLCLCLHCKCSFFSGVEPSKFEFKIFLAQFHNCVHNIQSDRPKLAILKSYLTVYALQLVSHLTLEDGNFNVAIDLLTKEFLDVSHIVNEISEQILTT